MDLSAPKRRSALLVWFAALALFASCGGKAHKNGRTGDVDHSDASTGGRLIPSTGGSGAGGALGSGGTPNPSGGNRSSLGGQGQAAPRGILEDNLIPYEPLYPNCENAPNDPLPFDGRTGAARIVDVLWNETALPELPGNPDAITTYGELVNYARDVLTDERVEGGIGEFVGYWLAPFPGSGFSTYLSNELPPEATDALYDSMVMSVRELGLRLFRGRVPSTLSSLLTSDEGYVDENLAALYAMSWTEGDRAWQQLPNRHGILNHPYFLSKTSWSPYTVAPIRGSFIQRELLCFEVPILPDVLPNPPLGNWNDSQSARDFWQAEVLDNASCVPCHRLITPLGLAFEEFDYLGRYREEDAGLPIDTTTEFVHPTVGRATFSHPSALFEYVSTHPVAQLCVTRRMLEFLVGYPQGGHALPNERLNDYRIQRFTSCALDYSAEPPDLDLALLAAHIVSSVDFQLTFRCGTRRCSRDIEICRLFVQGEVETAACESVSLVACPVELDPTCGCEQVGDEVTVRCINE